MLYSLDSITIHSKTIETFMMFSRSCFADIDIHIKVWLALWRARNIFPSRPSFSSADSWLEIFINNFLRSTFHARPIHPSQCSE